jgi:hypothetical protein
MEAEVSGLTAGSTPALFMVYEAATLSSGSSNSMESGRLTQLVVEHWYSVQLSRSSQHSSSKHCWPAQSCRLAIGFATFEADGHVFPAFIQSMQFDFGKQQYILCSGVQSRPAQYSSLSNTSSLLQ